MAQSITVMLIDDLDQSEAAETVRFGLDGTTYEIDLSARNASELRSMFGRYISAARRIRPAPAHARQPRQPRARTQMDREQSRRIRAWAMDKGLLASPRGRIPQHVVDEYEATMRVTPAPFRSPGTAEPKPAPSAGTTRTRPPGRRRAPGAAQRQQSAPQAPGATKASVTRADSPGLSDREQRELRTISDTARPAQNVVAGRLRKRGLVDRDSAGNWWLTDAGKREMAPA
jgi:Lsr2